MSQEFKLFRWVHLLVFGTANLIPTFCLIYAIHYGVSGEPLAMLSVVTGLFWGIYGLFLYQRNKFLNRITYITKHDIAVITNGFNVKQDDVERLTDDTIKAWDAACDFDRSAKSLEGLWVEFKTFPVKLHSKVGTFAGYTIGNNVVIGYKDNLIETAYQHELGHVIHKEFTGMWNNDKCHEFMTESKLP